MSSTVHLGERTFPLEPQKQARLKRRLGSLFDSLGQENIADGGGLMGLLDRKAYEVLEVFLGREFMPRWEWEGYRSAAAQEADDYDEGLDRSPTVPQIRDAITTAAKVNGLDLFSGLGKLLGPAAQDLLRALVNQQIAQFVAASTTRRSPSLPSESGESDSTTSSTRPSTSEPTTTGSGRGPLGEPTGPSGPMSDIIPPSPSTDPAAKDSPSSDSSG